MSDHKHSSEIHWSDFSNESPSSINDLHPPYDFKHSSESSHHHGGSPSSSQWRSTNGSNARSSSNYSSRSEEVLRKDKHELSGTRSLRCFVEGEMGLGAIHTGLSEINIGEYATFAGFSGEKQNSATSDRAMEYKDDPFERVDVGSEEQHRDGYDGDQAVELGRKKKRSRPLSSTVRKFFHLEQSEDGEGEGMEVSLKIIMKQMRSSFQRLLRGARDLGH